MTILVFFKKIVRQKNFQLYVLILRIIITFNIMRIKNHLDYPVYSY